jgi:hypothetical protein
LIREIARSGSQIEQVPLGVDFESQRVVGVALVTATAAIASPEFRDGIEIAISTDTERIVGPNTSIETTDYPARPLAGTKAEEKHCHLPGSLTRQFATIIDQGC